MIEFYDDDALQEAVEAIENGATEISLAENYIGDEGAATLANALANNESLHTLDLVWNEIGDEGATALANALANNESLHMLDLRSNNIGDEGAAALTSALANNESLHTLGLQSNNIGDEGASALANALANNESLHTLGLHDNKIGDEGATALANALANNESLQMLDLHDNKIGDEGAAALASVLANNESLHTLGLQSNKIGHEGATALANALAKNETLQTLNLGNNNIGDEGAAALANALAKNETLQTLNLSNNNIGDEGAAALANALANNESLQRLGLWNNNIGDEGALALANALANNESLQRLNLRSNEIGHEGATALANALAENITLQTLDIELHSPALEAALDRNQTLYEQSQTPLMQACKNGNISETEKLVVSGTRIDTRDTLGQTALFYVCKAKDENNALLLAKLLFKYSAGLSSESLGIRKAIKSASSKHYRKLSAFLSFIHSLPLAQLQTNALRMMVINLFDQGVQTLEEFRRLPSVRLSAQDRRALLQAFADPERAPDLKVRNAMDQTDSLGALATEVSLARANRGEDKVFLHPRLHEVFAEQLSRKNPTASLADFDRQQTILREKAHELTVLQEAVKTDSEKVVERDEARRDLVTGIRNALSGRVESQLETLLADPVTKDAVDSCHSLWKEILDDPVDVDDAVAQVTFEQMHEVTQAAVEALNAWETRHDTSAARKHTEAAIDALDERTKRLGIQPTYFATLRHPERTNELAKELKTVQQAFEAELDTLTTVDPMRDAPLEDVRRALASTISFYTRTVASEVLRLQACVHELTTLLSLHVPGLTAPNTSRVADIMQILRQSRRRRGQLEHDLKYAREDANDGDTEAEARIPGLEQELAQIGSVYKLDSELRKERARVLRHAEEHYPELLCDQNWIRSLGMKASVPRELSSLGLWLTNAERGDFETIAELASKPGKAVFKVRDLNGRDFVLKSFHLANDEWSSRFYRQVAALAQIKSAYIVRIQGVFMQDAHQGCTLMPFYSGGDLSAWIRDNPHADVATRRRIAIGLLSGLHDLHSQGFVHCDVKPENVYLAAGLSPVLGDFDGVQMHDVTMTQPVQATLKYMAPELRSGSAKKVEPAVDLFSAGMVLADLYEGADIPDAMQSLISSLRSSNPTQRPTALQALRHKAFQVEPVKAASCAICLDVYPVGEGVSCADDHFTCKECLSRAVRAATEAQSHVKVLRDGSMCCVAPECELLVSGRAIAATVPDEDFAALLDIVRTHFERDAAAEQERQLQDRVDAALREHGLDPTTQNHIRTIQNEVLAMSCPRCSTVFADFDGCCALKCAACPCRFCAWCLQDTGNDSEACHRHVATCTAKPAGERNPFFSDFAVVKQAWARLRAQRLRCYMAEKIKDQGVCASVENKLRPLLTPDIVGENFRF